MQQLKVLQRPAISPRLILRACHRDESSAASAARKEFFQPKDLVWLDSCDKHRNEEIKQAAAVAHSQQALKHFQESFLRRRADRRSGR